MNKHRSIKEDRNAIRRELPKNITIQNVPNEKFSLIEVVSDGRCFFGSFWLLSLTPEEIRMYMADPEGYEAMDGFVDNELSNFIKNEIFAKASKCQKMTMMRTHYVDVPTISQAMAKIFGEVNGDSFLMDEICKATEANLDEELIRIINVAYEQLINRGLIKEFDKYLMSYYQNNNDTDMYTDADPFLLGNFMSDLFNVNVNIVKNPPENLSIFAIDSTFIGTNSPDGKEDIYIYYRYGHFQPMIPNNRPPVAQQTSTKVSSTPEESSAVASTKSNLERLIEMGFSKEKAEVALGYASDNFDFAFEFLNNDENHNDSSNRGTSRVSSYDELDRVNGEKDVCLAEKKSLFEYFTFPKKLKIKYVSASNNSPTDLPSTGFFGSIKGAASTTDRIRGEESDNVYSKVAKKFTNTIQKVEISNGRSIENPSTNYMKATEDWYFLVTLEGNPVPVTRGGRTQKRQQKRGGRRKSSQKKRKTHFRRRLTKRR